MSEKIATVTEAAKIFARGQKIEKELIWLEARKVKLKAELEAVNSKLKNTIRSR